MIRICYFTVSRHSLPRSREYLLRLVVQSDDADHIIDHYFEYGAVNPGTLHLSNSLWAADPEWLIDHVAPRFRVMAALDVRQFARNDLDDALSGSLMADDFEILFSEFHPTVGDMQSASARQRRYAARDSALGRFRQPRTSGE